MKIGLAQINPKVGDFNGNKQKILLALDALKEAEIVVFPELALTGYPPEDLLFNRDFLQQSQQALREIARSVPRNQVVILGAPEKEGTDLYNSAFLINGGEIVGSHRKVLLPNYDVFDEMRYFKAGTTGTVLRFCAVGCSYWLVHFNKHKRVTLRTQKAEQPFKLAQAFS